MIDPRPGVFERRFRPVRRIVAVGGGKGGVGKTTICVLTALTAAAGGARVGFLDLDLHGAAAHLLLGISPDFPSEDGGLLPLEGPEGIHFMSAAAFSGDRPLALRGAEVSSAVAELLAVTLWPELDLLLVDLPPGLGDAILDVMRFIPRAEVVAVTTPSLPAVGVSDRFLSAVRPRHPVAGLVANMVVAERARQSDTAGALPMISRLAERHNVPVLARVQMDEDLEPALGDAEALLRSRAAAEIQPAALAFCARP